MRLKVGKFIFIFFFIFFILISSFPSLAQKVYSKKDPLRGFDEFIVKVMEEWRVPGLAISIVKDNKVIYSKGFGYRNVAERLKVTPKTLFAIGSCSKAFTATAMGILVDEGKLEWDKPLRDFLPTFKLKDSFASERMTPRDLVCHRSGLPRHDMMWYNASATREELFNRLQFLEPNKDFRTTFQYQNLMFMTAGYLVGKITNSSWEEFVRKRIFEPLKMMNSNFSVEDSKKAPDFSLPYLKREDKVIEIPFRNIDAIGPAGSINSNVEDMANWLILNLNKGEFNGTRVISEASLNEIHSPQIIMSNIIREEELFYYFYGMGWAITAYRGHLFLVHGGGIDGFIAHVSFMPKDKIGVVILTNLSPNPLTQIISFNAYDRLLGLDPVPWIERVRKEEKRAKEEEEKAKKEKDKDRILNTSLSHPIDDYLGEYHNPGYGVLEVVKEGDKLKTVFNALEFPMEHYHYDIFEVHNEMFNMTIKISFFTDPKGNISSLSAQLEPAVEPIVFIKMPEKRMKERSFLEKFVGEYQLAELVLTVSIKGDNTLILRIPGQPEIELIPYKGTEYNAKNIPGVSIEFMMDESGVVREAKLKQPQGVFTAPKKQG